MSPLILVGLLAITTLNPSLADVKHVLDGSAHPPDCQCNQKANHQHSDSSHYSSSFTTSGNFGGGGVGGVGGLQPPQGAANNAVPGSVAFWWADSNSPFKHAYDHFKKCSLKNNCVPPVGSGFQVPPSTDLKGHSSRGGGQFGPVDIKKNVFLNGQISGGVAGTGVTVSGVAGSSQTTAGVGGGHIDISGNPFLNQGGQAAYSGNGQAVVTGSDGFLGVQPAVPFGKNTKPFPTAYPSGNTQVSQQFSSVHTSSVIQPGAEPFPHPGAQPFPAGHPKDGQFESCKVAGYVCVPQESCLNGVVQNPGQRNTVDYCEIGKEVCCRLPEGAVTTYQPGSGSAQSSYSASSSFTASSSAGSGLFGSTASNSNFANLSDITAGKSSVPGSTIKFGGSAGLSPGYIQVVGGKDNIPNPHISTAGESGSGFVHTGSSSITNKVVRNTTPNSNSVFPSTIDYSNDKLDQLSFVSTTRGPPYLPPISTPVHSVHTPDLETPHISTYQPSIPTTPRPIVTKPVVPGISVVSTFVPSSPRPFDRSPEPQNIVPSYTPAQYLPPGKPSNPTPFVTSPSQPPTSYTSFPPSPPVTYKPTFQTSYLPPQTPATFKPYSPSTFKPYTQPPYNPSPSQTVTRVTGGYSYPTPTPAFEYPKPTPKPLIPSDSININHQYVPPSTTYKPFTTTFKPYTQPPYKPSPTQTVSQVTGGYSYPTPTPAFEYPNPNPSSSINVNTHYVPPKQPNQYIPPIVPHTQPTPGYRYPTPTPPFETPRQPSPSTPRPIVTPNYNTYVPPTPRPIVTQNTYVPPRQPSQSITVTQFVSQPTNGYKYPTPTPYFPTPSPSIPQRITVPPYTPVITNNQYLPPVTRPVEPNRIEQETHIRDRYVPVPTHPTTNAPTYIPPRVPQPNERIETILPPPGCAAALRCVQEIYCTADGFISQTPVVLTKDQEYARVPTTECQDIESGIIGRCCRDANYVDPWPSANLINGFDNGQYREDPSLGQYFPQKQRPARSESSGSVQNLVANNGVKTSVSQEFNVQPVASVPQRYDVPPTEPVSQQFSFQAVAEPSNDNTCGLRNVNTEPRGPGPIDAGFGEIPWQAMILRDTNRSLLCGGVIVKSNAVLTAAHCLDGLYTSDILIKGGEWKLGIDEEPLPFQIVKVAAIIRHPNYQPGLLQNDVAVLILAEKLRYAGNIGPICLPAANQPPAQQCIVTGWGKQILQAHLRGAIMRSVDVNLLDSNQCSSTLSNKYQHVLQNFSPDTICAYSNNDQCDVDYGSALACSNGNGQYTLAGIFSWDTGCKDESQIGGYIPPDVEWIESTCSKPLTHLKTLDRQYYRNQ